MEKVSFRDDNDIDHLSKEDNTPPKRTSNIPTQSPISKPRKSHHRKSKTTSSITSTIFGKIATSNRIGSVVLSSGDATATAGSLRVTAGEAAGVDTSGGALLFNAGTSESSNNGGTVLIQGGAAFGKSDINHELKVDVLLTVRWKDIRLIGVVPKVDSPQIIDTMQIWTPGVSIARGRVLESPLVYHVTTKSIVEIESILFYQNQAIGGGAVAALSGATMTISLDSRFEGNKATDGDGGAVFVSNTYTVFVSSSYTISCNIPILFFFYTISCNITAYFNSNTNRSF